MHLNDYLIKSIDTMFNLLCVSILYMCIGDLANLEEWMQTVSYKSKVNPKVILISKLLNINHLVFYAKQSCSIIFSLNLKWLSHALVYNEA